MEFSYDDYSRKYNISIGINFWEEFWACVPFTPQKIYLTQV